MRHPQQQMTYEQQQALLFQHQLMVQQVAQQSILLQQLQAQAMAASTAAAAAAAASASFQQPPSADVPSQQLPINQAPTFDSQQIIPPQATSLHHQLQFMHQLQQSQYEAAAFSAAAQSHVTLPGQVSSLPYQQQDLITMFLQASPPLYQYLHPYYWNVQLLHGITPLPAVGLDGMNQGVEPNYQDNNQEVDTEPDADENAEDMDEDEEDDDDDEDDDEHPSECSDLADPDTDDCKSLAESGECNTNPGFMKYRCASSCGTCRDFNAAYGIIHDGKYDTTGTGGSGQPCTDLYRECKQWAGQGECAYNPDFMLVQCERSCMICFEDT